MPNPIPSLGAIAQMITKTNSVMTPLLIINLVVASVSTAIYFIGINSLWVFLPDILVLIYSIYRYERFANENPHLLSSTEVQKIGMQLAAGMGQKNDEIPENEFELLPNTTMSHTSRLNATKGGKK